MKLKLVLISRWRWAMSRLSDLLARRWRRNFYLYLAGLVTLFAVLDAAVFHVAAEMRQATFDVMVRYRLVVPKPDPDIVIVDVDEASLAAMSKEYGRWPWPRQVLGEFLEHLEKQQPRAVVFDMLFSDADVYNPDSDAYFNAAVAASQNVFFPMLRLDPASDSLSEIRPGMIPGVVPFPDESPREDATVAVILPHFQAALEGGRLGTHNIYPDSDGVARRYPVWRDDYGWKIPSLPARIGKELGWAEPATQNILLNWRGKPFSYKFVSFSDVFADMQSREKRRPQDEFRGKIVILGSTAPSLFDLKATPMARIHPGVEVLATAIDNVRHGDSLRFPEGRVWPLLVSLAIVWLTALAFYRDVGRGTIDRMFGLSQFILLAFSYASINLTNTYINLTGPVMIGLVYFSFARIYASATGKALEQNMVRAAASQAGSLDATLLLIRFDERRNVVPEGVVEKVRLALGKTGKLRKSVDAIKGEQRGLWGLFEKTIAVSWLVDASDEAAMAAVQREVDELVSALPVLLRKHLLDADHAVDYVVHRGRVAGGGEAGAGWRAMFAGALLKWNEKTEDSR